MIFYNTLNLIAEQVRSIARPAFVNHEVMPVKTINPIKSSEPHKAISIFGNTENSIMRKSIFGRIAGNIAV
jgi:hypothetical protein